MLKKLIFLFALFAAPAWAQQQVPVVAGVATVDVSHTTYFKINVTSPITSVVLTPTPTVPKVVILLFAQDGTGHAVTFSQCSISAAASAVTACSVMYDTTANSWFGIGSSAGLVYPAAGLAVSTGNAWTAPAYTDVTALWSGSCSISTFLRGDGSCASASGSTGLSGMTSGQLAVAGSATTVTSSVAAPVGTIVGTTDTQTLTNKTLDGVSPTTMGFVDPTSSIQTQLNGKQASLGFTAVPTTRTVNGHALSGNVTVSFGDLNALYSNITALWTTCTGFLKSDGTCVSLVTMTYPSAGIAKSTGTAWTAPAYTDVSALWASGSCSGYLNSDGTCSLPGTVNSGLNHQIAFYGADGTAVSGFCTPPTNNGSYAVVYNVTAGVAVDPDCVQQGFLGRSITGATSADTVLFTDNESPIWHDAAASASNTETLPTPTTLKNTGFAFAYCNMSTHADTISPTTWTINGAATFAVGANGVCTRVSIDPNPSNPTNWLATVTPPGASGISGQTAGQLAVAGSATTITSSVPAPTGTVVGTTDTQTLTNKTVDTATPTEIAFVHGVTSAIQTQLDSKASSTASVTVNGATCTLGSTCSISPVISLNTTTPITVSTTALAAYYNNQNATAATAVTYNLPTAAAGKQFCFTNSNNGSAADTGVLTIATSATGQFIIFTDGTLSATGGNITSGGAAADAACVVGIDSTHWQAYVQRGTWTKN